MITINSFANMLNRNIFAGNPTGNPFGGPYFWLIAATDSTIFTFSPGGPPLTHTLQ